jgi:ParB-like nuclease domain
VLEQIAKNGAEGRPWREAIPVHPAAELFPLLAPGELRELAQDIKKNGMVNPVVLTADGKQLVDGRSRLDACELVGVPIFNRIDGSPLHHQCLAPGDDPHERAVSLNIRRRHLTTEQKREVIAKFMKARPELSDRQIAKHAMVSPTTVAVVRASNVQPGHKPETERLEASGRKARGHKPGTIVKKPTITVVPPTARPPDGPPGQKYSAAPTDGFHLFDLAHNRIDSIAEIMVA